MADSNSNIELSEPKPQMPTCITSSAAEKSLQPIEYATDISTYE